METSMQPAGENCWQSVYEETFSQSETQECVVPDTLPDIAQILLCSACALIRSKDVSAGRVRLEANVQARIACLGEDGSLFCMDLNIPFYLSAQDERITDAARCVAALELRRCEARMLNPRKISVRAELNITVRCYTLEGLDVSLPEGCDDSDVHILVETANIACVRCVTEKSFALTDEAEIPDGMPPAVEIIAQSALPEIHEVKAAGSKLIFSGVIRSAVLYRCAEGALHELTFQTSFSQIIETERDAESALTYVTLLLSGMYYELLPESEGRELAVELHLVAQAVLFENTECTYLADAYSNTFSLEAKRDLRCFEWLERKSVFSSEGIQRFETPEPADEVISCIPEAVWLEGENTPEPFACLRLQLCFRCGETYQTIDRVVRQPLILEKREDQTVRICSVSLKELTAKVTAGGIEVSCLVEFQAMLLSHRETECIRMLTLDKDAPLPTESLPSIVMLRYSSRQPLWTLARDHCSTVEAIIDANGLSEEERDWEKLLIVPKTL